MPRDLTPIRGEYDRLHRQILVFPGEREWPDRIRSWDDFEAFGELVAEDYRELLADERNGKSWAKGEPARRRAMAPELLDLVLRTFPAKAK